MSPLSFVALSMQTTHLDPATVSKVSYLKMVDGQATRLDSIAIIPPTTSTAAPTEHPRDAVSWPEALSQLGMVIGKLPIVSYYRDADKEIFHAASRRSDITPPTFEWFDGRALCRELLPELPDHQPSTVLTALDLYEEHADSVTVEQTAQIVLQLAATHQATTVRELWGELRNQPENFLGLEATLEGISFPEPDPQADGIEDPPGAPESAAIHSDVAPVATPQGSQPPSSAEAVTPPVEESTADLEETAEASTTLAADVTEEDVSHDEGDSTAQSVIERENLEQPEFLKTPDHADVDNDKSFVDDEAPEPLPDTPTVDEDAPQSESLDAAEVDTAVTDQESATAPLTSPADQQPPDARDQTRIAEADRDPASDDVTVNHDDQHDESAEEDSDKAAEPATPAASPQAKPFDPVYQVVTPAPVPRPGVPESTASNSTQVRDDGSHDVTAEKSSRHTAAPTGRLWGMVGMLLFGVLTVTGLVLTVMAVLLFFTTNTLLVETKIAGVILTGAITLLSMLMATLSYRNYRKNSPRSE